MTVKFSTRNLDGSTEEQAKDRLEKVEETLDMLYRFRMLPDRCNPGIRIGLMSVRQALQEFENPPKPTWQPDGAA